jgi:hypothetical protein
MYCSPSVEVSASRVAVWYRLRIPVIFHWKDGVERIEGEFTSDVAVDGALILSGKCPAIGCDVRLEVLIPCPDRDGNEFRIECIGKVTRYWRSQDVTYSELMEYSMTTISIARNLSDSASRPICVDQSQFDLKLR